MGEVDHVAAAAQLLADRRTRDAVFGADRAGFGEPGWDMLLALFVADGHGQPLTWAEAIERAFCPGEIATRYLEWLVSSGLAMRDQEVAPMVSISSRARLLIRTFLDTRSAG